MRKLRAAPCVDPTLQDACILQTSRDRSSMSHSVLVLEDQDSLGCNVLVQEGECADTGSEERLGVTIALRTECHHPSGRGISRAVIWVLRSVIVSASDSPLALVRAPIHPSSGSSQALAVAACRCCLPGIPLGLVRVSRFGSFTTVPHEGRVTHGSTCKRSRWCRVRHRTSGGRGALLHPLGLGR